MSVCPTDANLMAANECVSECPTGTNLMATNECVSECPTGTHDYMGNCITCSGDTPAWSEESTQCVACNNDREYVEDGLCKLCPHDHAYFTGMNSNNERVSGCAQPCVQTSGVPSTDCVPYGSNLELNNVQVSVKTRISGNRRDNPVIVSSTIAPNENGESTFADVGEIMCTLGSRRPQLRFGTQGWTPQDPLPMSRPTEICGNFDRINESQYSMADWVAGTTAIRNNYDDLNPSGEGEVSSADFWEVCCQRQ